MITMYNAQTDLDHPIRPAKKHHGETAENQSETARPTRVAGILFALLFSPIPIPIRDSLVFL
jgi:hypothetical protein